MTLATRIEEQELDQLAIELFTKHESHFTPTHPWVLVRVLPREQKIGSLWLPDGKQQNKPVHEGIVLHTWRPFLQQWREKRDGEWIDCERMRQSDFEIGDHVTYPWAAGMNASGWDERYYRLVPEHVRAHRGIDQNGIIFGKLNYPRVSVRERLKLLLELHKGYRDADMDIDSAITNILSDFDVVSKDGYSKTTSGASKDRLL
jgi:hypothetical protein